MGYTYGKYSNSLYKAEMLRIGKDGSTWFSGSRFEINEFCKKGDFCIEPDDCAIYKCVTAGNRGSEAEWELICHVASEEKIKELINVLNTDVVSMSSGQGSNSASYYEKLPTGTLIQYGVVKLNASEATADSDSLTNKIEIRFKDDLQYRNALSYSILLTGSTSLNSYIIFTDVSTSGFNIVSNERSVAHQVRWMCIGLQ